MHDLPEKLPSLIIERPKMPRATWEALRAHIMRERLRKKQEQEQNQAVRK
jgi:G protein pathway suppressor 2